MLTLQIYPSFHYNYLEKSSIFRMNPKAEIHEKKP